MHTDIQDMMRISQLSSATKGPVKRFSGQRTGNRGTQQEARAAATRSRMANPATCESATRHSIRLAPKNAWTEPASCSQNASAPRVKPISKDPCLRVAEVNCMTGSSPLNAKSPL